MATARLCQIRSIKKYAAAAAANAAPSWTALICASGPTIARNGQLRALTAGAVTVTARSAPIVDMTTLVSSRFSSQSPDPDLTPPDQQKHNKCRQRVTGQTAQNH